MYSFSFVAIEACALKTTWFNTTSINKVMNANYHFIGL